MLSEVLPRVFLRLLSLSLENTWQDLGFPSVELRKRKRKNISGIIFLFVSVACCCGLCVPNMTMMKANAKRESGGIYLPFHYESGSKMKSPDFHL